MKKKPGVWIQAPMIQIADKGRPPFLLPRLDPSFFPLIGRLIAQWAVMEQNLNILLWALLEKNNTNEPGWRKRVFDKRYDLLRHEWTTFSASSSTLSSFIEPTYRQIKSAKFLRDGIGHKEIIFGAGSGQNHCIRFYNYSRAKQKSKPYYLSDFQTAIQSVQDAAGWLCWVTDPCSSWPLPSQDTSTLCSLPNTDHLRLPK